MMKKFKRSVFIILAAMSLFQPLYPMISNTAPKAANFCKIFKNCAIGGQLLGLYYYALLVSLKNIYIHYEGKISCPPADAESQAFVKQTFKEYGYDQEFIDKLNIFQSEPGDSFGASYSQHNILVPFNADKLLMAKHLEKYWQAPDKKVKKMMKKGWGDSGFEYIYPYNERCYDKKDKKLEENESLARLISPESLKMWKSYLCHEAGHILNDPYYPYSQIATFIAGLLTTRYATFKGTQLLHKLFLKNSLYYKTAEKIGLDKKNILVGLGQFPSAYITVKGGHLGLFGYSKFQEYAADTEAINRANDPAALRKSAKNLTANYQLYEERLEKSAPLISAFCKKFPFLYEFTDEHPRGDSRAKRLIKKAEELEAKEKKQ